MTRAGRPLARNAPRAGETIAEAVARYVRIEIFDGRLLDGQRLPQDDVAAAVGVSRIPVREAIIVLEREGTHLHILGVDDAGLDWTRGVREHYALPPLAARLPSGAASVLLSHRPDLFAQAAGFGIGLVLSGHTHGGQLALPWPSARPSSLAHFISDFPRGTYRIAESTLHVNLGLGVTGQPVRVFSPREITLITLRTPATIATGETSC